jgi:heat-inducible transcriptional repressor
MTQYPSLVLSPQLQTAIIRHIQLVKLSGRAILIVVVTDTGFVENKMIELQKEISSEELDRLSTLINQRLRGLSLQNLQLSDFKDINSDLIFHDQLFNESMKVLIKSLSGTNKSGDRVHIEGATKMLEQPEFLDLQKFKPLLNLLEEENRLYNLLYKDVIARSRVKIGHENQEEGIRDCSVVTASYEIAGRAVGVIGVLGPTRMDYAKVLPVVEGTAAILSDLLTQMSKWGIL